MRKTLLAISTLALVGVMAAPLHPVNANGSGKGKFELNGIVESVGVTSFVVQPKSMSKALKKLNLTKPYTVNVDSKTKFQTSGMKAPALDDILPGDRVNLIGKIQSDNSLLATKVNFKRTGFSIVGTITAKGASTFDVQVFVASKNTGLANGATAVVDPTDTAKFTNDEGKITFADLAVNDRVVIHGYITLSGTTKMFNASRIVAYP